ncbi:hypothetical protein GCM10020219_039570 [Nonomuraea dietziae]
MWAAYPWLRDDEFVAEGLDRWLALADTPDPRKARRPQGEPDPGTGCRPARVCRLEGQR